MHTETKDKHDRSLPAPFPPEAHFDAETIEQAKPVERLGWTRFAKSPRFAKSQRGLRVGTAIVVGLMFVVLEIGTLARLNSQINAASAMPENPDAVATTEATSTDESAAEVSSVPINTPTLAVNEVRRGRIRRQVQPPRVNEFEQLPLTGKPKARRVGVIH